MLFIIFVFYIYLSLAIFYGSYIIRTMTTKNKSRFTATFITVSRKDYDECLTKDQCFLQHLFATYRRTWSVAGVSFYNLDSKDFVKLFKLLT